MAPSQLNKTDILGDDTENGLILSDNRREHNCRKGLQNRAKEKFNRSIQVPGSHHQSHYS